MSQAALLLLCIVASHFYTTVVIVVPSVKQCGSSLRRTRVLNIYGQL